MKIRRRFTQEGAGPYAGIAFDHRVSEIRNPDGSIVFRLENVEVPAEWSQVATDILAQKYFRKAGVPQVDAAGQPMPTADGKPVLGARPTPGRCSTAWPAAGATGARSTATSTPPRTPRRSTTSCATCSRTRWPRPNSPQWFNTGLHCAYGITGPAQGHCYVDPHDRRADAGRRTPTSARSRTPASSSRSTTTWSTRAASWTCGSREARLFKYGSGTGTNFSTLRGENEPLSGGGKSSGLMSFLQDRRPGRRRHQERRHHAPRRQDGLPRPRPPRHRGLRQLEGARGAEGRRAGRRQSRVMQRHLQRVIASTAASRHADDAPAGQDADARARRRTPRCARRSARRAPAHVPAALHRARRCSSRSQGFTEPSSSPSTTPTGTARPTTPSRGQNSNNSVRIPNSFFEAVDADGDWKLDPPHRRQGRARPSRPASCGTRSPTPPGPAPTRACSTTPRSTSGTPAPRTAGSTRQQPVLRVHVPRRHGLQPGVAQPGQVPRREDGTLRRRGLPPRHPAVDDRARDQRARWRSSPAERSPQVSYEFRTLGLGYANLGTLLMRQGIPYDCAEGAAPSAARSPRSCTGEAYATSAEMAARARAVPRLRAQPRRHAAGDPQPPPRRLQRPAVRVRGAHDHAASASTPRTARRTCSPRRATRGTARCALGEKHGYRNAQVTVIAPTGTIGLLMDCDTTGIEPDFALVKFKKLAGGGYFKIINQSLPPRSTQLGYDAGADRRDRRATASAAARSTARPHINHETLAAQGLHDEALAKIEAGLGRRLRPHLRLQPVRPRRGVLLETLGLTEAQLERLELQPARGSSASPRTRSTAANDYVCGTMTVEGAPHLQGRAPAGVRLRQPLRQERQALHRARGPHPHDGRGPAVHLGRDLARPSTCRTRRPIEDVQRRLPRVAGS